MKKVLKVFGIICFALAFYFAGYLVGHHNLGLSANFTPQIVNRDLGKPKNVDFNIFWDSYNLIKDKYAGEFAAKNLVYGAVKGMVQALGDPYSAFMEPSESKTFTDDLSGQIEGIGAEISQKDGQIVVVAPLKDSPAEKAGLKPNDQVLEINGEKTTDMNLEQAISKIRGKAGTEVKLKINRTDFQSPQEFTIKREIIVIKSVKWEMKDNNIGYIEITQFGSDTSGLIEQAANELASKRPKAIVLDLRNNPGGYLDAAIDVSSVFMPRGVVVQEKNKDGSIEKLNTTLEGKLSKYKVIILINEGSASASEITAGALRDSRGSLIIGKKSFGKGSVQEIESLQEGATLRLTVAKWLTPNGTTIDKEGIKPDIEVNLTTEDKTAGRDPQLDRALQEATK